MPQATILYKSMYWKAFQFIASLAVNIIIARLLRPAISAEFYSSIYIFSLAISFFTFGLDIGLNYFLSKKEISARVAIRVIALVVLMALCGSLPLLGWYYQPERFPHIPLPVFLAFAAMYIAGGLLAVLSGSLFTAYGKNYLPSIIGMITSLMIVGVAILTVCCAQSEVGIEILVKAWFLTSFVQGLILIVLAYYLYAKKESVSRAGGQTSIVGPASTVGPASISLRTLFKFSSSAFVTNMVFFVGSKVALYLIPYCIGPGDQGNYIQAFKLVEYMGIAAAFIYYPVITMVAGQDQQSMHARLAMLVRLSNTCVLLVGGVLIATGWWLFPFVFGRSFDRMYGIFCWFIPGLFATCSSSFFTAYFFGTGKMRANLISSCIQLCSALILFFAFVRTGGVYGVALSFSIAGLLSLAYDSFIFMRTSGCGPGNLLFLQRSDGKRIMGLLKRGNSKVFN